MRAKLLGVQEIDMTSKTGDHIKGANLFVGFKNRYVNGIKTQKYFLHDDDYVASGVNTLEPDDDFNIYFDDNGKIDSIDVEVN